MFSLFFLFQKSVSFVSVSFLFCFFHFVVIMYKSKENFIAYNVNISKKNVLSGSILLFNVGDYNLLQDLLSVTSIYTRTNILWHMHISKWILEGKPYCLLMDVILFCTFYSVFVFFFLLRDHFYCI